MNKSYSDSVCHQINRARLDTLAFFPQIVFSILAKLWADMRERLPAGPLRAGILWHRVDVDRCFMIYGIHSHRLVIDKVTSWPGLLQVRQRTTNYWFKAVMTQACQRSQSGVPSFMVQPFHKDEDGGGVYSDGDESRWWGSQMGSDWVVLCNHCCSEIIANDYWPLNSLWSNVSASHSVLLKYNFSFLS